MTDQAEPTSQSINGEAPVTTVGCVSLDSEHEAIRSQLVKISRYVASCGGSDFDQSLVLAGLDDVALLVADHFAHEEALLELSDYPLLAEHRNAHQLIVNKIQGLSQTAREGISHFELLQESQQVEIWLITHFNTIDQLYRGILSDDADVGGGA